jgi:large subunit ribosomal protein L35
MPKMKSHTGMGKRVKVTGTGKILAEPAGKRHRLEVKSSRETRRLSGNVEIAKADMPRVKRMLGR